MINTQPHIRIANLQDAEVLCQIGAKTFTETYGNQNTPENLQKYLDENFNIPQISDEIQTLETIFLLVEIQQEVIGYAKMRLNLAENPNPKALEIERIYVAKAYHGQKYGAALIQKCIEIAQAQNYHLLWLGVWEHNPKAMVFYKKWGFKVFGKHNFQLGDELQTDYLMQKEL